MPYSSSGHTQIRMSIFERHRLQKTLLLVEISCILDDCLRHTKLLVCLAFSSLCHRIIVTTYLFVVVQKLSIVVTPIMTLAGTALTSNQKDMKDEVTKTIPGTKTVLK